MNDMIEITGLWISKTKTGEAFFSGYMGNAKVLIFKNKYKESDKHPDYKMYVTAKPKKEEKPNKIATPEDDFLD